MCRAPATAAEATLLRAAFGRWIRGRVGDPDLADDLILAVYEALANVVDHAYPPDQPGPMTLHAHHTGDAITITIRDRGRWCTEGSPPEHHRGRGLALIRGLVARVDVEHHLAGTSVHLQHPHPTEPPPQGWRRDRDRLRQ